MSAASLRRSGRKRTRNTKYSDDLFADAQDLELVASSSEQHSQPVSRQPSEPTSNEFAPATPDELSESEHHVSSEELEFLDAASENDISDDAEIPDSHTSPSTRRAQTRLPRRRKTTRRTDLDSGGIGSDLKELGRDQDLLYTFGPDKHDTTPIIKAADKWYSQPTATSRLPYANGIGGFAESFYLTNADREAIAFAGWDWYYEDGGRKTFETRTVINVLDWDSAQPYICHKRIPRDLVWGPFAQQILFNISTHHSLNLNHSWIQASQATGTNGTEPIRGQSLSRLPRHGWCINLSHAVHQAEWIPNHSDGHQYVALATWPKDLASKTSAFTASGDIPSSIQIWEVSTTKLATGATTIDDDNPPRLVLVLCFDWGLVKQFSWCSAPRKPRPRIKGNYKTSLGLLAVIHGDGKARVFDVVAPKSKENYAEYRHYSSTAFESCPPDGVYTCLTWISPSLIAVGCSNGYVAIFDLSDHLNPSIAQDAAPFPTLYHSFHMTFVRAITSCSPSRPNLLATTAMDGNVRLTDIRAPYADHVYAVRSRTGCSNISWHEQTQHLLATDENYTLRSFNVRQFFKSMNASNLSACPLSLATSPIHPFVLVGLADGAVNMSNPLRRIIAHKRQRRVNQIQKWFKHEWRRGRSKNAATDGATSSVSVNPNSDGASDPMPSTADRADRDRSQRGTGPESLDFPDGLIRLTTGYPPHIPRTTAMVDNPARRGASGVPFSTIYEEESGVRSVAWNPNISCGGWAVAGMASGLVIIEDLALD